MVKLTKKELEKYYKREQMTYAELATKFNTSVWNVQDSMRLHGISSRKGGRRVGLVVTDEHKTNLSKGLKGKSKSAEHRANLSKAKSGANHPRFGKSTIHPKRYWFTCPNGDKVSMRSNWEVCYAEWLNERSIKWEYEPKSFVLGDGARYTPDFYLIESDTYIEVKGWLHEKHKVRLDSFRETYPQLNWILADKTYLNSIGCDLTKRHECEDRPKLVCKQCSKEFFYKDKHQVVCSVECRNRYVTNPNREKVEVRRPIREYKGTQGGESNNSSKLKQQDVLDIVAMRKSGLKLKEIASAKSTSITNVGSILSGRSWKQLTGI